MADLDRHVGSRVPASCTALGKAIIAGLQAREQRAWIGNEQLQPCAPNAIVTKTKFRRELELVRDRGFAINNEELVDGLVAIAALVPSGNGTSAAVSVAASTEVARAEALAARCSEALLATASKLGEHIEYEPRRWWHDT